MPILVKMPQLGETVVEGTVSRWLKAPGEIVRKFEPLLEITTDKIDTEVPAPGDGILLQILVAEGATVKAGVTLGVIGGQGEDDAHVALAPAVPSDQSVRSVPCTAAATEQTPPPAAEPGSPRPGARPAGRAFVSPVVTRIAAEHGLDLADIPGTGLGGRVTRQDVEAHLAQRQEASRAQAAEAAAATQGEERSGDAGIDALLAAGPAEDVLMPLTAMRRAIAQHMVMSKQTSPHVTTVFEVDMTAVVRHREANRRSFAQGGVPLTYTAYFVAATVAGLQAVPEANSRFTPDGILLRRQIHVGMAVAIAKGLLVPVIHNADELNLQGLARTIADLVERTRAGQLAPDEVQGGTFTLTNHGTGGSLVATPIINQPQSGILGVGAIVKRPVVRSASASLLPSADDAIVIRPMVYLSYTFDHRVLDGAQADAFLTAVKGRLENWG
jgi:2-oxoglutarate dehydrogenase E2 component (dihydrolipoamide succinyltransferase)